MKEGRMVMDKRNLLNKIPLKEDKLLVSQVLDKLEAYLKTGKSQYTYFLDTRQVSLLKGILTKENINFSIYRFQKNCERSIIVFGGISFGIVCYQVKHHHQIRHQDVLGSLFGLGLKKEMIGDIFVEQKVVYFMILESARRAVEQQLDRIGSYPIQLEEVSSFILEEEHFIEESISVLSLRLDVVLSKLLKMSRSKVDQLLSKKQVLLNYIEPTKSHMILKEDDVISIRGYGKYRMTSQKVETRSGKIKLIVLKYQ